MRNLCAAALLALSACVEADQAALEPGVIIVSAPAHQASESLGAGAVTGIVIGGVAGGALGSGAGRIVGAAVGAAVGGTLGATAEAAAQPTDGAAYTVRLSGGRVVTVLQHLRDGEAMLPAGAAVTLETRGRSQHVSPASG